MTKDREHFIFTQSLKFNNAQIKFDSNSILLTIKTHIDSIFLIKDHDVDSISLREITRRKLSSKKQYLAKRVKGAYVAFVLVRNFFQSFTSCLNCQILTR